MPTISGTAKVGATLTVSNGTWGVTPLSFRYAWFRCDANGDGCNRSPTTQSSPTYVLTSGDAGFAIIAQVAPNGDWSRSVNSPQSAVVSP